MKTRQDICWAIEWCSNCHADETRNPCYGYNVPDHIPDNQILRYINTLEETKSA